LAKERPVETKDVEPMHRNECFRFLAEHDGGVGRLALDDEHGTPRIFPINFVLVGDLVVFRTGEGTKLRAAQAGSVMTFECDTVDEQARVGCSVAITGRSEVIDSSRQNIRLSASRLDPVAPGSKGYWVAIHPDEVSGRRIVTTTWL